MAMEIGNGFLYQDSFAHDRTAVVACCQTHQDLLRRFLEIKQAPDLTIIQKALARYCIPLGCLGELLEILNS